MTETPHLIVGAESWSPELTQQVLAWVLAATPVPAPHVVKMAMVKEFVTASRAARFVETGTYEGETTAAVAALGVDVWTIELSEKLHAEAVEKFADRSNVHCLQGDSGQVIQSVLSQLNEPAVFWLDGHFSAGKTARGDRITPLVEELFYIFHHNNDRHVVLIDDVRGFDGESYPTVGFITEMTRLYWPNSRVDVMHDILRIRPTDFPI